MCGIVGYVGPKNSIPVLIGGLEKLEYRGYDSAGVSMVVGGEFEVYRTEGKLANLKNLLAESGKDLNGETGSSSEMKVGIGHTRWATHGKPSEVNAHPHVAGKICLVHNGIIENYLSIRERLRETGCKFHSETDTEIAAHLVNHYLESTNDLYTAVKKATSDLEGSFALLVMSSDEPDCLVVSRNATPIIVGLAEGESYVASDIPAILQHTRQMLIIEDGEIAKITTSAVHIERDGELVKREPTTITWDPITAEKGGFRHFMLKEIHEQPQAVTDTFRGRVNQQSGVIFLDDAALSDEDLKGITRITIVACGTAWHAALITRYYIENFTDVPVEVDYGSEFRYRKPLLNPKTLFIVISQSGETADTLGSLKLAKKLGAKTLAICNVVGSTVSRTADSVLYTHAGPEISVASTKAFVTQLVAGYMFALRLAAAKGSLQKEERKARIQDLVHLPTYLTKALQYDKQLERVARKYGRSEDFLFLGRGFLYPIALEGALKLKEISYVHAEGYPAGEMKHGPIALIDEETPVVMAIGHDGVNYEKAMSNLKEVESRGGRIIVVTDRATPELTELAWELIEVGEVALQMLPIVLAIPLQLLAYHVAVYRGTDVDQPRNLAKSVTVE